MTKRKFFSAFFLFQLAENMSTDDMENVKGAGFMSQFGRTMFTAALLVIGWKLLRQN